MGRRRTAWRARGLLKGAGLCSSPPFPGKSSSGPGFERGGGKQGFRPVAIQPPSPVRSRVTSGCRIVVSRSPIPHPEALMHRFARSAVAVVLLLAASRPGLSDDVKAPIAGLELQDGDSIVFLGDS